MQSMAWQGDMWHIHGVFLAYLSNSCAVCSLQATFKYNPATQAVELQVDKDYNPGGQQQ
jgi:hypothetical protein